MSEKEQKDIVLIQNILKGDRKAENEFFEKYLKFIKNYIKSKFPKLDEEDVKDCASITLLKVYENLNRYNPEKSSVKTWVMVIVKNVLIDTWRQNQSCPTVSLDALTFTNSNIYSKNALTAGIYFTATGTSSIGTTGDNLTTTTNNGNSNSISITSNSAPFETCNSLCYLSSQITPADYQLLHMKYMQGYNYCEIGQEFNLSSVTISNRINYIKSKLKKANPEEKPV